MCEDVEITIRGVTGLHHIFVIDAADHQLALGEPFLNQMRVEIIFGDDTCKVILHSEDGKMTAEFIATIDWRIIYSCGGYKAESYLNRFLNKHPTCRTKFPRQLNQE